MVSSANVFIYSAELEGGGYPHESPFNTRRAGRVRTTLDEMGLLSGSTTREVSPVSLSEAELLWFHTSDYLKILKDAQEGRGGIPAPTTGLGTPDCPIFPGMYDYVRLAGGGSLTGARLILNGEARMVFNPSGGFHHAQADRAAGFCYLNDVVIAAMALADAGKRVAILDVDVHHGDGQQAAFYDRRDVLTISMHESGHTLFPGTGFEAEIGCGGGLGYNVNIPLPVGAYDSVYEEAFLKVVLPLLKANNPDIIMLELGMDTLAGDPLAHLNLTNNVIADLLEDVRRLGKPMLAVGGGGYHIANTVRGWVLCWSVLTGDHEHQHDLGLGMGGVMLENTDWLGGLRDRVLLSDAGRRGDIHAEVERVIHALRASVFPIHGL